MVNNFQVESEWSLPDKKCFWKWNLRPFGSYTEIIWEKVAFMWFFKMYLTGNPLLSERETYITFDIIQKRKMWTSIGSWEIYQQVEIYQVVAKIYKSDSSYNPAPAIWTYRECRAPLCQRTDRSGEEDLILMYKNTTSRILHSYKMLGSCSNTENGLVQINPRETVTLCISPSRFQRVRAKLSK